MKKTYSLSLLALAAFSIVGAAQAQSIVGAQSPRVGNQHYITVGKSEINGGPHRANRAGIGVSGGRKVDFQGLSLHSTKVSTAGVIVHTLPPQHGGTGGFSFIKAGAGDVWFGEWSRDGRPGFNNRQVFYVGNRAGTTLPTSGTANYAVRGVNKFTGANLLRGTVRANFATRRLSGSLQNDAFRLNLGTSTFNTAGAISGRTATARSLGNNAVLANRGQVRGQFFGANAASLAGIVSFAGKSQYDTSFGGSRGR